MTRKTELTALECEALDQIHADSATIQHYAVKCFIADRVGDDWLTTMRYTHDRMNLQLKLLEKLRAERIL